MKPASFITVLATMGALGSFSLDSAHAAWVRLPNNEVRLINLASEQLPDTGVESSNGINNAANLIHEDPTEVATLSSGSSSVILRLSSQQYVDMVAINNGGAAGAVKVAGSSDKREWIALAQADFSSSDITTPLHFAPVQVRYIKLQFETTTAGPINNVMVSGAAESAPADAGASKLDKSINAACAMGGARAIYASPTPANLGNKEYDLNIIEFPASKQSEYSLIYDLGATSEINDVAVAYSRQATNVQVYAFNELPEKKDWRGKLALDPAFLSTATPVAGAVDSKGLGRIKVTVPGNISARYLAIRLQPASSGTAGLLDQAVEKMAATLGFGTSKMIASGSGGFSISSIFIGASTSSQAFNQVAATALGMNGGEGDTTENTPAKPGDLDTATTPLIPPAFLGMYDYRITGGFGGGSGDSDDSDSSPPQTIVRRQPVFINVPSTPEVSPVTP